MKYIQTLNEMNTAGYGNDPKKPKAIDKVEIRVANWRDSLIEASYQAQSNRRVKNSRIWSMHDIAALHGDA